MCFLDVCGPAASLALCGHRCGTHQPGQGPVTTWVRVSWASGPGSPPRLPLGVRPDQACLSPDLGPCSQLAPAGPLSPLPCCPHRIVPWTGGNVHALPLSLQAPRLLGRLCSPSSRAPGSVPAPNPPDPPQASAAWPPEFTEGQPSQGPWAIPALGPVQLLAVHGVVRPTFSRACCRSAWRGALRCPDCPLLGGTSTRCV